MKIRELHPWNLSMREARAVQERLARQVRLTPLKRMPRLIAGADISFNKFDTHLFAGVVVLRLPGLEVVEERALRIAVSFPYVPGFLSFREIPPLLEVFRQLEHTPAAVVCDGQGIAHPRGLGLAAHLGLCLDLPCLGCAKTRLFGVHATPGLERWSTSDLLREDTGERLGLVVRTRRNVQPVYLSPGHKIDFAGALEILKAVTPQYRLPETTRRAHELVNRVRREAGDSPTQNR